SGREIFRRRHDIVWHRVGIDAKGVRHVMRGLVHIRCWRQLQPNVQEAIIPTLRADPPGRPGKPSIERTREGGHATIDREIVAFASEADEEAKEAPGCSSKLP